MLKIKSKCDKFYEKYNKMNIAIKASLWFAICSIIQKGISIITLPIFTRLMSTKEYGEYNIFLTWYNILIIITTLNIQSDIFNKGLIEHSDEKDDFTTNQASLLILLTLLSIIVYLLFKDTLNMILGLSTGLVLIMFFEILANAIVNLWQVRRRFDFEYRKIVMLTIFMSVINPVIGIVSVYFANDKAFARIVSNAIVPMVISFFLILSFSKNRKEILNYKWWKPVIISSIPLVPHYLSLVLLNQSDKLMINYFVGQEDTAIYSVAHSAGLLLTIINTSINSSFVPWVYRKLEKRELNEINSISTSLLIIVLTMNLFIIWLAPEIIHILAAPQYKEAMWCLAPIAMSVFFFFAYTLFVDVEIYFGESNYIAIASIVAAALNLFLNYIFIPRYGYIAAGYTTLFSYVITMVLHYLFLKKIINKYIGNTMMFNIRIIIVLSTIMLLLSFAGVLLYKYVIVRLIIIAYAIMVIYIKRQKIIQTISKIRKRR